MTVFRDDFRVLAYSVFTLTIVAGLWILTKTGLLVLSFLEKRRERLRLSAGSSAETLPSLLHLDSLHRLPRINAETLRRHQTAYGEVGSTTSAAKASPARHLSSHTVTLEVDGPTPPEKASPREAVADKGQEVVYSDSRHTLAL